ASIMDIIADCKWGKLGKQKKNEIGFNKNLIRGRMIMYVNQEEISMLRLCSRLLLQQNTQAKSVSRNGWLFFYLVSSRSLSLLITWFYEAHDRLHNEKCNKCNHCAS